MFKRNMTPLTRGGQLIKHQGKGSSQAAMPDRSQINSLAGAPGQSINNYAKATPMPMPSPQPGSMPSGAPGIGSGDWSGNGM